MATYIIRRMLLMGPTLLGILAVVFFVMAASPGDVSEMLLSSQGEMQASEKRIRVAYLKRRYGLDKPLIVQFGRWLNRISPVGFRTSSEMKPSEEEARTIRSTLAGANHIIPPLREQEAEDLIIAAASYLNEDFIDYTRRFIEQSRDPVKALSLLMELGALEEEQLSAPAAEPKAKAPAGETAPQEKARFVSELKHVAAADKAAATRGVLERLRDEAAGLDRLLFTRPALKAPDFGQSFVKRRPVLALLAEAMPITLILNLLALPLVYTLAMFTGAYAARHRGKLFDVGSSVVMLALWSIPVIWAGVMLQGLFANRDGWVKWFPTSGLHGLSADQMPFLPSYDAEGTWRAGWLLDSLWHLALPVICLSYGSLAFISKLTRGAMLENIMADYVRTARAKGVSERVILWRHVFRNSLLPLITVAAFVLPALLSGSVIVEYIFSIEGMGKLMVDSIKLKDQEVVMADTLLIGMISLFCFLVADVLYAVADPRVAYE